MLFVSHDRYFINKTATRILNLTGKRVRNYIGNYDYFLEKRETEKQAEPVPENPHQLSRKNEASAGKADWKAQKEEQAKLRKLQNQISRTEAEIEQAEERLAQIDGEFAKPEVATNSARLSELHAERTEIQEKLDGLYELWESLSE